MTSKNSHILELSKRIRQEEDGLGRPANARTRARLNGQQRGVVRGDSECWEEMSGQGLQEREIMR